MYDVGTYIGPTQLGGDASASGSLGDDYLEFALLRYESQGVEVVLSIIYCNFILLQGVRS